MSSFANTSLAITAAAAGNMLVYSGTGEVIQLTLAMSAITGATVATFNIYDNNAAASTTAASGATWSSKSPGYTGRGPNTARVVSTNLQSSRYGDQQSQSAPNGSGVRQYWDVNTTTGDLNYGAAPGAKITASITAAGTGSFNEINSSSETGNTVAAVTAARMLYTLTLIAGETKTWTPANATAFSYGINVTVTATGMTASTSTAVLEYDPLP